MSPYVGYYSIIYGFFISKKNIDILKLDVEGAELDLLNETETLQWLLKFVKVLLVEWHMGNSNRRRELAEKGLDNLQGYGFLSYYNEFRFQGEGRVFFPVQSFVSSKVCKNHFS